MAKAGHGPYRRKPVKDIDLDKEKRQARRKKLRANYGLSVGEADKMLDDQQGRCAICESDLDRPHIDHCHRTGRVRGILCHHCNVGIGFMRDDPKRLRAAAAYLDKARLQTS